MRTDRRVVGRLGVALVSVLAWMPAASMAADSKVKQSEGASRAASAYDANGVAAHFAATDADHDGAWSLDEARAAASDPWWINSRFSQADTNRDGVLTLEEVQTERQWEAEHPEAFEAWAKGEARDELLKRWNASGSSERALFTAAHPTVAAWLKTQQSATAMTAAVTTSSGTSKVSQGSQKDDGHKTSKTETSKKSAASGGASTLDAATKRAPASR